MNPDQQDFESLRRLLALKRHEQPPPGYFHHFSREVILRIRAGEDAADPALAGWLRRIWNALETKPSLAGALGAALSGLMLFTIISTQNPNAGAAIMANEPVPGPFQLSRASEPNPLLGAMTVRFSSTNGLAAGGRETFFEGVWPKASFANFPNQ